MPRKDDEEEEAEEEVVLATRRREEVDDESVTVSVGSDAVAAALGSLKTRTSPRSDTVRWVMRSGLTTASTTAPRTWSPATYLRCGSAGRMWKSATVRAGGRKGRLKREKKERRRGGVVVMVAVAAEVEEAGVIWVAAEEAEGGGEGDGGGCCCSGSRSRSRWFWSRGGGPCRGGVCASSVAAGARAGRPSDPDVEAVTAVAASPRPSASPFAPVVAAGSGCAAAAVGGDGELEALMGCWQTPLSAVCPALLLLLVLPLVLPLVQCCSLRGDGTTRCVSPCTRRAPFTSSLLVFSSRTGGFWLVCRVCSLVSRVLCAAAGCCRVGLPRGAKWGRTGMPLRREFVLGFDPSLFFPAVETCSWPWGQAGPQTDTPRNACSNGS